MSRSLNLIGVTVFLAVVHLVTCQSVYGKTCTNFYRDPDIKIDPQVLVKLTEIHLRYLERESQNTLNHKLRGPHTQSPGSEIQVNGNMYEIISILGSGLDGIVYLVKSKNGLQAVKKFHANFSREVTGIVSLTESGKSVVKIEEIDAQNETLLLEYVKGLPIALFVHSNKFWNDYGDSLGITDSLREYIAAKYSALPGFKQYAWTHNHILGLDGFLTIIDTR